MIKAIGVAEAKRRFSEFTSRILFRGERFIIKRKGKPVAALVSIDDLKKIENVSRKEKGLLASIGAWEDFENLDEVVEEIYKSRQTAVDRKVELS